MWPVRPLPKADESLTSWLIRLAHANGLSLRDFIRGIYERAGALTRDFDFVDDPAFFSVLAAGSGAPADQIAALSLATLEQHLQLGHDPQLSWIYLRGHPRLLHRSYWQQVCPDCLGEGLGYFRRAWRFAFATCCPQHHVVLIDRCPRCSAALVATRGRPPNNPFRTCHKCGADRSAAAKSDACPAAEQLQTTALEILAAPPPAAAQYLQSLYRELLPIRIASLRTRGRPRVVHQIAVSASRRVQTPSLELQKLRPNGRHALMAQIQRFLQAVQPS